MDKKNNMKQAMFEMFGVGSDQTAKEAPVSAAPAAAPKAVVPPAPEKPAAPTTKTAAKAKLDIAVDDD